MKSIKKILVATDFTEDSQWAMEEAAMLAKKFNSVLYMLDVVNPIIDSGADYVLSYETVMGAKERMMEDARKKMMMKVAEIDSIGQGRIWCGTDALKLGLVDQMGGIFEAVEFAAKEADLDDYCIDELPVQKDFLAELMDGLDTETATDKLVQKELGEFAALYEAWKSISTVTGCQARLPYFVIIH